MINPCENCCIKDTCNHICKEFSYYCRHIQKMQNAVEITRNQIIKGFRLKAAEMLLEACGYDLACTMKYLTKAYGHKNNETEQSEEE